jgi:hypothetical protein
VGVFFFFFLIASVVVKKSVEKKYDIFSSMENLRFYPFFIIADRIVISIYKISEHKKFFFSH